MENKVENEFKTLKTLVNKCKGAKKKLAMRLAERAAFMLATLTDLEEAMAENGCVSEYKNGENQFGTKKSPEVDIYNTMIKNYTAIIKQIGEMIEETGEKAEASDGFDEAFQRK